LARNASIGVVVVMVALAAVGSWENRQTGQTARPEPSPGPVASSASSSDGGFPDQSPSPPPSGSTLLSIKGTGDKTSDDFHANGDSVDVEYGYTCGANDSFTASFFGAGPSPILPDILVSSDTGASDSSITTEDLNGNTGPFHLEIASGCTWSVEVIGQP
jgi:hypothetical protein